MEDIVGIIGGRFGLYGYLPAVLKRYSSVNLSIRHQCFIKSRNDLVIFYPKIIWLNNDLEVMNVASLIIFAVPPIAQKEIVLENIKLLKTKKIFLEKPLAESPELAEILLKVLVNSGIDFRINYTLSLTDWFVRLKEIFVSDNDFDVDIKWNFLAHHFKEDLDTWKKYHSKGGGCLRFFAIHLIAILRILDFKKIQTSQLFYFKEDIPYKWLAVLRSYTSYVNVSINSVSEKNLFQIRVRRGKEEVYLKSMNNPFETTHNTIFDDVRSLYLLKMIEQSQEENVDLVKQYADINELWANIERSSQHVARISENAIK